VTLITGSHRIGHRLHARLWGRAILATCGVRLRVHGLEALDPRSPYVFMINHNSHFAGYAVAAGIPMQWRAVLGMKLRKIPVFGWIGALAGHIFVETRNTPAAIETMNRAAKKIRSGLAVLVFPEGAHHDDGALLRFKSGGFHLAVHAQVPLVPLTAVEHRRGVRVRVLDLYVDPPIPTAGSTPEDVPRFVERVRQAMMRHLNTPEL
jgi:1-acyl-sn-glycerol-3-phosphate acyltransferase